MTVDADRDAELAADVEEEVRVVEVVRSVRYTIAIQVQRGNRTYRLAVDVLVPVEKEPPAAVQARLHTRRRVGDRTVREARVEHGARSGIAEALEAEEHAKEHGT